MGNVKDHYIHYEKADNQFCGQCVTGLSSLKKEFAVSPVHWDFTKSGERGTKGVKDMIEEKFVGTNEIEPHLFELVTYLFAAVFFHFNYLDRKFRVLGVDKHTLVSHSCQKGAITVVSTGFTVSPPMSSICLCAG